MLDNKGFNLWTGFFGKNGSAGTGKNAKGYPAERGFFKRTGRTLVPTKI